MSYSCFIARLTGLARRVWSSNALMLDTRKLLNIFFIHHHHLVFRLLFVFAFCVSDCATINGRHRQCVCLSLCKSRRGFRKAAQTSPMGTASSGPHKLWAHLWLWINPRLGKINWPTPTIATLTLRRRLA